MKLESTFNLGDTIYTVTDEVRPGGCQVPGCKRKFFRDGCGHWWVKDHRIMVVRVQVSCDDENETGVWYHYSGSRRERNPNFGYWSAERNVCGSEVEAQAKADRGNGVDPKGKE